MPSRPPVRLAGFSLVEILVVITIIGLLMTIGFQATQGALESSRVTTCKAHLQDIGKAMLIYKDQRNNNRWPRESGIRFLLTLYRADQISGKNAETFLCPGTEDRNDTGGEIGSSYDDWENIDSAHISYAGRDQEAFPIRGNDYAEIIIASDDNEFAPNHRNVTNFLYADGSTGSFDVGVGEGLEIADQYPEIKDTGLPIGPDCPFEPLRVLRID